MKKELRKQEGSIPWTNLMVILMSAFVLTAIILLVLALLLYKFQLSKSVISTGIILTYVFTCFMAGNLAGRQMKQKRFLWGLLMGIAYFVVLLLLSIVVNSSIGTVSDSLFTTLILCIGGGMLGGMLS
ncbi:MAG: TIGR04086 family membrane protein [Lachnospiraceae bacterium]|nr:TIGR04086 family membrane protein [Lachnospiraceae bacterium]